MPYTDCVHRISKNGSRWVISINTNDPFNRELVVILHCYAFLSNVLPYLKLQSLWIQFKWLQKFFIIVLAKSLLKNANKIFPRRMVLKIIIPSAIKFFPFLQDEIISSIIFFRFCYEVPFNFDIGQDHHFSATGMNRSVTDFAFHWFYQLCNIFHPKNVCVHIQAVDACIAIVWLIGLIKEESEDRNDLNVG